MNPFFTVGHSTHTVDAFVALLRAVDVELVVDVRTIPRSRTNPHYNRDVLPATLKPFNLDYIHIPELGGLRSRRSVARAVNGFWQNESFHNYADYAMCEEFRSGLCKLRQAGHAQRCVVMCAEAVWWRCHRRIIADYLIAGGETVIHILAKGRTELARITEAAVRGPDATLAYPPPAPSSAITRTRRSTGWRSYPAVISNTFVIGRRSSSGHGCSPKPGGLRKSDTLLSAPNARVNRKRRDLQTLGGSQNHAGPNAANCRRRSAAVAPFNHKRFPRGNLRWD